MIYNTGFDYGIPSPVPLCHKNVPQMGTDFGYGIPDAFLGIFRRPPNPVQALLAPGDQKRVPTLFTFEAQAATHPDGLPLHYILEIASDSGFANVLYRFQSQYIQSGWQYYDPALATWVNVPAAGVPTGASRVRYSPSSLSNLVFGTTYYWRMVVTDTISIRRPASPVFSFRFGNKLAAQLKNPIPTASYATSIIFTLYETIPTDGAVPAVRRIWVTNNAFDPNPTWEDATDAYRNRRAYQFQNRTKVAAQWGVNVRYEVEANDSLGVIELRGLGFNFN